VNGRKSTYMNHGLLTTNGYSASRRESRQATTAQAGIGSSGRARRSARPGFTLVELLAVITIIGIILSLVLVAGMDAANRANERATQALITKLDQGLNNRWEALMQNRPEPNYTHGFLGAIYSSLASTGPTGNNPLGMIPPPIIPQTGNPNGQINPALRTADRAQAFAWYDYIKSEMPDVFYVQNSSPSASDYPLNFAGVTFLGSNILPLGQGIATSSYGDGGLTYPTLGPAGTGVYGASYSAAAGVYKGLGYLPAGYDGVDNDQDGNIDNWNEGVVAGTNDTLVLANLGNHTHVTARAEMLYALVVEGSGPLGSVFSRDDFTDREVRDTDGDGMPEFVDAWGQPLQFFRWPVFYHSDVQRGVNIQPDTSQSQTWDILQPYLSMIEQREQDPIDPNQLLVAPAWWSNAGAGGLAANDSYPSALVANTTAAPTNASVGVQAFEALFHPLTEPLQSAGGAFDWDRGATYPSRRAFYYKFLILSSGPDQTPGVFLYSDSAIKGTTGTTASQMLIANENNAMPFGLELFGSGSSSSPNSGFIGSASIPIKLPVTFTNTSSNDPTYPSSYDLWQAAQDDITNHNLSSGGVIGGSG
jgi:prepilin-type N-terminal cleavage/methylation domain-containing protein